MAVRGKRKEILKYLLKQEREQCEATKTISNKGEDNVMGGGEGGATSVKREHLAS